MKKIFIIVTAILLLILSIVSFLFFKQNKELKNDKIKLRSKTAGSMALELDYVLLKIRHDFLIDALHRQESNPELLEAIKTGKSYKYYTVIPLDFDLKSYSICTTPPSSSRKISFVDYVGFNKDKIKAEIKRYFPETSIYKVSITEDSQSKVFTVTITENPNWKINFKKELKKIKSQQRAP